MHEANRTDAIIMNPSNASIMRMRVLSGLPPVSTPSFPFISGSLLLSSFSGSWKAHRSVAHLHKHGVVRVYPPRGMGSLRGYLVCSVGTSCTAQTAGASGIISGSTSGIYRCTVRYLPPDPKIVCFFARSIRYLCIHGHHMYSICETDW